jgi:hypothetical protein
MMMLVVVLRRLLLLTVNWLLGRLSDLHYMLDQRRLRLILLLLPPSARVLIAAAADGVAGRRSAGLFALGVARRV